MTLIVDPDWWAVLGRTIDVTSEKAREGRRQNAHAGLRALTVRQTDADMRSGEKGSMEQPKSQDPATLACGGAGHGFSSLNLLKVLGCREAKGDCPDPFPSVYTTQMCLPSAWWGGGAGWN